MQFRFSKNVTIVCSLFVALMLWASYWQYTRYVAKSAYVKTLMLRLEVPVAEVGDALTAVNGDWVALLHRRLRFSGAWDFDHEMILRNRLRGTVMGGFVITPLKTELGTILVNRGFLPLQLLEPVARKQFQKETPAHFIGLIKEGSTSKLFAPKDPPAGGGLPWVDQWLRVDIGQMQKQIPNPLVPVYVEMMPEDQSVVLESDLFESKSNRDEIFIPGSAAKLSSYHDVPAGAYPIPTYDSIVPAGRHYSYIFEWAIMAGVTVLIGLVLQLKRGR